MGKREKVREGIKSMKARLVEIYFCAECPHVDPRNNTCNYKPSGEDAIQDIWSDIPEWCPLQQVEVRNLNV